MPFTFSHPAIILPLCNRNSKYFSATALVAGSMAPDFEYFINMRMQQVHGHTLAGMIYYDLPLAILLCFAFHLFIRKALILYSPIPLKKELVEHIDFDWISRFKKCWLVITYSALIGVASHLFWDSFTHANRFFVNHIPFLNEMNTFFGWQLHNYATAQLLCSLIGAGLILLSVTDKSIGGHFKKKLLPIIIYWMIVLEILMFILILRQVDDISVLIATTISGGLIGMMIAPIIMKWLQFEKEILHNR